MDDELFDIVDENDRIIGQTTRKEAHTKGHIHRSVLLFLFDNNHRIFVNQRTSNKEFYPNYWSLVFGGHVKSGESYETSIRREAAEETGIHEINPRFLGSFKKRFDYKDKENVNVYIYMTSKEPTLDPTEINSGSFLSKDEIEDFMKTEKFLPETDILIDILKRNLLI